MSLDLNATRAKEELQKVQVEFKKAWRVILDDVLNNLGEEFGDVQDCVDRIEQIMERNVPFGKQARAFLSIFLYRTLKPERTEEDDFLNYVSGWMIEIMQAGALIADDIMDESETRRGMPCWHRNPDVGLSDAVNDVYLLDQVTNYIAHKYFSGKDYHLELQKLGHENNVRTVLGQSLDLKMAMANDRGQKFNRFTEATYKAQVKYKTSYYTFHGPVANALIRAGIKDAACHEAVEDLTLRMGELFQIQDDFLDCYGDPDVTGKVGTDIRDGKMTWLIVKAIQRASKSQLTSLHEHYGQPGATAEYEVKSIYFDLGIEELFYKHEDAARVEILTRIKALPLALPQEPFLNVLSVLYRREK